MKWKLTTMLIVCLFLVSESYAQDKKKSKKIILSGIVIDNEHNPVQNATVFFDGKNTNVKSDEQGKFRVKIKPSVKTIVVFSLFNGVKELEYQGQEEILFILDNTNQVVQHPLNAPKAEEEKDLVNVGYGIADKRDLTTSVGEVSKQRMQSARHYSNIYEMIKGEVPGVSVNGNSIIIRGESSLKLSNEPLYVVNGSPTSSISDISPSDVKSISILKGASAAIYGSRGANGVILIVLKSGEDK